MKKNVLKIGTVIAYFFMIIVNYMAQAIPLNGVTMADVSASVTTLFTPPGYVFAIWTLIYGLLFCYVIFQFLPAQRHKEIYVKISIPFIVSCLLNSLWVVLFHYFKFGWCLIVLILLMLVLAMIYVELNKEKKSFKAAEEVFVYLPFSIYFAWTTIAVIANVTIVLQNAGWGGFGLDPIFWLIVVLLIGLALAQFLAYMYKDPYILMVYLWAYLGITYKFIGTESRFIVLVGTLCCLLLIGRIL